MGFTFKVEGLENLQKAIESKRKEIGEVFNHNLEEGADRIISLAQSKAPVLSGNLRDSIGKNSVWERGGKYSIYVGIQVNSVFTSADGYYARMQEYGTSKMPAHQFLRPAFNENKAQINNEIVSDLQEVLKESG